MVLKTVFSCNSHKRGLVIVLIYTVVWGLNKIHMQDFVNLK